MVIGEQLPIVGFFTQPLGMIVSQNLAPVVSAATNENPTMGSPARTNQRRRESPPTTFPIASRGMRQTMVRSSPNRGMR